jgi:hypothetical protein
MRAVKALNVKLRRALGRVLASRDAAPKNDPAEL